MLKTIKSLYRSWNRRSYRPLNHIEISRSNLLYNYRYLTLLNHRLKIAPVLKSNAYGHGIAEVVTILDGENPPMYCVDSIIEAKIIRKLSKTPVLIMGYVDPQNLKNHRFDFSYTVFDIEFAKVLNQYQPGAEVHIFVDTGMHREGITLKELPEFLQQLKTLPNLKIIGLMSHFASADDIKSSQNKLQIANFQKALNICKEKGVDPTWRHISASNGLFSTDNEDCNLARIGKALYGIDPLNWLKQQTKQAIPMKPVLKLFTQIIEIKQLSKGVSVGYSATFRTKRSTKIAILPIGYFDGVDRRLSNKGVCLVDGINCSIIGRISMNITVIDITELPSPHIGQPVIVISDETRNPNSIINIAKITKTIPHEIMVHLSATNLRRVIV